MNLDVKKIERREWHLWFLAIALILFLGTLTVATYFFTVGEYFEDSSITRSMATRALWGVCILITLFCVYILHTHMTLGKTRRLLETQALRDPLTGLFNRQYFKDRMEGEKARVERSGKSLALLLCDLDHFKEINDTLGHQAGDEILKEVAKCFQASTRGTDLVFRWGGDEIVVLLSETTREGVLKAAERIREGILKIGDPGLVPVDLSIGVAIYPEHGRGADELIRLADRALYIAKKGGDKVHIGEEEYELNEHSVKIVFQPVVNTQNGEILGYEALSRDPQGKLAILELFNRYQAVGQLQELKSLCFRLQLMKAHQLGLKRVFINIDFNILHKIEPLPKPSDREIILEISEQEAVHDVEKFLEVTRRWREKGYKFAIDDFGSGFVSLPFLARLIPDYIKMDRSTVVQAVSSQQFGEFLKDLVIALRNYTTEGIIAEGIETEKELKAANAMGTSLAQGFLLGRPQELK